MYGTTSARDSRDSCTSRSFVSCAWILRSLLLKPTRIASVRLNVRISSSCPDAVPFVVLFSEYFSRTSPSPIQRLFTKLYTGRIIHQTHYVRVILTQCPKLQLTETKRQLRTRSFCLLTLRYIRKLRNFAINTENAENAGAELVQTNLRNMRYAFNLILYTKSHLNSVGAVASSSLWFNNRSFCFPINNHLENTSFYTCILIRINKSCVWMRVVFILFYQTFQLSPLFQRDPQHRNRSTLHPRPAAKRKNE